MLMRSLGECIPLYGKSVGKTGPYNASYLHLQHTLCKLNKSHLEKIMFQDICEGFSDIHHMIND